MPPSIWVKLVVALYLPPHFAVDDFDVAKALINAHPFALLVSFGVGEPWLTHLPLKWDEGRNAIIGHVAKANPHARLIESAAPSLAVFSGPHAYISPSWYATPEQVPTWNYAVVHVHSHPMPLSEPDTVAAVLDLVKQYETGYPLSRDHVERQAKGVLGFALPVERFEIKLKMSQNKSEEDRLRVVEGLLERDAPDDRHVAGWMAHK
jgi:transcriptional regulator